jgi:FKBP-type peptidyl-prolyl cis-trans isomerase FklB
MLINEEHAIFIPKNERSRILIFDKRALIAAVLLFGFAVSLGNAAPANAQASADELYLEENAKKPGVIKRPSGLQIKVIRRGKGSYPNESSVVRVQYEGRLVDGTIFDSTYDRREPAEFQVGRVIEGWQEAMLLMQIGSEWELTIPAKLAYAEFGAGDAIPPGATLIFRVELLAITSP